MAKQITIPGFIHASMPESWAFQHEDVVDGVKYDFWTNENMGGKFTKVCPYEMTFTVPDEFDPVQGFVASLQGQKQKLMADHQNALTQIDRKIQELLAITCEAA